ncbi:putative aldo keto reductase protein [Phaeoacremonium minimum UCRPA7]|uniref:Putative aldo keto reductase protein n=1 Tax=Phaeoacremonium minimum (strain UCR-PA7) TaxID=1286976 RepID=R8BPD8_PHAM7|nr:putative aldo keto reductase protein [Phaeoacremonium minimum UCRPA7]EOO01253.1 putative aldo keto reductase protein [Phaeoacremonium minimum UCRPA7]
MAVPGAQRAKVAHVNMMTDTIISNLSLEGFRIVLRALLTAHASVTETFETATQSYIQECVLPAVTSRSPETPVDLAGLQATQKTIRCMLGCGLCFQSIPLLGDIAARAVDMALGSDAAASDEASSFQASIDGDIVQAMTAVQKTLKGTQVLANNERGIVQGLYEQLADSRRVCQTNKIEFPFARAFWSAGSLLEIDKCDGASEELMAEAGDFGGQTPAEANECFEMAGRRLPRIFTGLWQLSSPAWGSASAGKIFSHFSSSVQSGFVAFDMADHYGDAEIIFGQFAKSYPQKSALFAATKYCVFHPITVSRDVVRANVTERCQRLQTVKIDLLQFHWQFVSYFALRDEI